MATLSVIYLFQINYYYHQSDLSLITIMHSFYNINSQVQPTIFKSYMASFDISSSYNVTRQQSISTFHLLTQSHQFSPINQLNSAGSSNLSPQILFPNSDVNKGRIIQSSGQQQRGTCNALSSLNANLRIDLLLDRRQIYESFQIDEPFRGCIQFTESNFGTSAKNEVQKWSSIAKNQSKELNKSGDRANQLQINYTASKPFQRRGSSIISRTSVLKQFEQKMEDLKCNVSKLKAVVDRFHSTQKKWRRQIVVPEDQQNLMKILPAQLKKLPLSTQSGARFDNIEAKSVKSENILMTPQKTIPIISQFQLHRDINKFQIDQMSPIVRLSQIKDQNNKKLNTSESSSRMLMKRKFNVKKSDGSNTI